MKTILIYATRRQRARLVKQGVEILAEYDDYVLAQVAAQQVTALQTAGYEIEPYGRARAAADAHGPAELHGRAVASVSDPPSNYGPGPHYYLVDFIGPIKGEWLDEIRDRGGRPQDPVPPASYVIALDDPAYAWLTRTPRWVQGVTHYGAEMRLKPGLPEASAGSVAEVHAAHMADTAAEAYRPPAAERVTNTFSVRFFASADLHAALPAIRALGGVPSAPAADSVFITVSFEPARADIPTKLAQLASLHGVRSVEPYVLRQTRNDVAAGLMAAQEVLPPLGLGLSGRGEIVGVADSGLDSGEAGTIHPDFAGRIATFLSWPVSTDWASVVTNVGEDDGPADTRSGHGTHVSGSVCGDGRASLAVQAQPVRGLAFEARLTFQAIEQRLAWTEEYRQAYYRQYRRYPPEYGLAGLPVDLQGLFQQAYAAGARIHSNSWGGGEFGAYDHYTEAVDRFMWEHKDFLIFFAAGNDGADWDRDGRVDAGSVTPPATAKNCVTIGAAESVRASGGYQRTYGQLWPADYGVNPLRDDKPSDNADDIAAFSSRGPTTDGRIKPDLVAPGTNILSTRSQVLVSGEAPGWGKWPPSAWYMFNGGTSMATPLAAGAAALVRQYLRQVKRRNNPSAALIKATLIHAAARRRYRHAAVDDALMDVSQGWGHVHLQPALQPSAPYQVKWYDQRAGLQTGQSWKWSSRVVDASLPFAVTLAWTDYPGSPGIYPNLVNDLDLVVTSPSGAVFYGNSQPGQSGGAPDRVNNVERVVIPQPELGRYRVRVRAFNVPRGPQDFAVVYSGGIS